MPLKNTEHSFDNRIKNGNRLKDDIAAIAGQKHELDLARDKGQRQKQHKGDEPHGLAQRIFRITLVYLTHKQRTNARKRKGKTERHVRHLHGKGQWIEEQERADHETDEKQRMDVSLDLDTAGLGVGRADELAEIIVSAHEKQGDHYGDEHQGRQNNGIVGKRRKKAPVENKSVGQAKYGSNRSNVLKPQKHPDNGREEAERVEAHVYHTGQMRRNGIRPELHGLEE